MARKNTTSKRSIQQYDHRDKTRVNVPPVGLVTPQTDPPPEALPPAKARKTYQYDPHLDPQLVWAGKAERTSFEVPTVSLHVHERIDPRTIVEAVRARNGNGGEGASGQMPLFGRPEENPPLRDAINFYDHKKPLGWKNRLIAGDSLLVMNSLIEKEGLAGGVQMVYIDPPYGIRYGSNFQPFVNKRDVKDGSDDDLTLEPETLKAFRDTWELGIHSYLTYLRDRLLLAKELLHESGSCFVQISDENLHLIRNMMDDVFGPKHHVVTIPVKKKGSQKSSLMDPVNDYLIWYTKTPRSDESAAGIKFRRIYEKREIDSETLATFKYIELADGRTFPISALPDPDGEVTDYRLHPRRIKRDYPDARLFKSENLTSGGVRKNQSLPFEYEGRTYAPKEGNCWKTTVRNEDGSLPGMRRLALGGHVVAGEGQLRYKGYLDDFGYEVLSNWWDSLGGASDPVYVVQTNPEIIQRCILMTTDPGDLVLDPTCGSGTTAYVAEQWGRRWITTDTSRVAITLARQRLMTASFDYYTLRDEKAKAQPGSLAPSPMVSNGFVYKTVPHVTLKSIANNPEITPGMSREAIDRAIAKYADTETLYDQPEIDRKKTRVTGPFTVEAVPAAAFGAPEVRGINVEAEMSDAKAQASSTPLAPSLPDRSLARSGETLRQSEWRAEMLKTGIRGKGGAKIQFVRLEPLPGTRWLSADAETKEDKPRRAVISFGPEHAPLEQRQVAAALEEAYSLVPRPALVIFASLQFDPEASKDIDETKWPGVTLLKAQMNGDLVTDDLKKKRASNESFWLVGQPDIAIRAVEPKPQAKSGTRSKPLAPSHPPQYIVEVHGFDYYNPRSGKVESGGKKNIAMWMLDTDYDGRSVYPRQVFFPMSGAKDGWARLAKNLRAEIDQELIEQYRGTESLPFAPGEHGRVAVKIVDDRGIESLRIMELK